MRRKKCPKREHSIVIKLNEMELKALEQYCAEYRIGNRARWIRETLMREVISRFEANSPTLFSDEDLR